MTTSGPTVGTNRVTAASGTTVPFDRLHVNAIEIVDVVPELRKRFEDDLIVVRRRVDRRDLARAEGVVELLADLIDADAVDGRFLAIDLDDDLADS